MDEVYYRLALNEDGVLDTIFFLVPDSSGILTCRKLRDDTHNRIDDDMYDWIHQYFVYEVRYELSGGKLIAYHEKEDFSIREVESAFVPGDFIRTVIFNSYSKKDVVLEYKYLCSFSEIIAVDTITDFTNFLIDRIPEFNGFHPLPEVDEYLDYSNDKNPNTLDSILNYDPAKDPMQNPWIDIFGEGEEAETAYWNTD